MISPNTETIVVINGNGQQKKISKAAYEQMPRGKYGLRLVPEEALEAKAKQNPSNPKDHGKPKADKD